MTGESRTCQQHAVTASSKLSMHATCLLYDESSCTWCCCPCSTRREGTGRTMNTSMLFSNAGSRAIHSKFFMPPRPRSTRPTSSPSKLGVLKPILHWLMSYGNPPPSDESAAVNLPWIPLTSRAPSQGPYLDLRTTPGRLCLGKHLRARRLRPQARRRSRYRRPCRRHPPWRRQVFTWIGIMLVHRYRWLTPCAQWLVVLHHRALLLQVVVPLLRFSANRCARAQALWDSDDQCAPRRPHQAKAPRVVQTASCHTKHHALSTLPCSPFRFRPLALGNSTPGQCLALWVSLSQPCSRPLMDPLHDDLLEEALADRGPGDEVRMDPVDSDSHAGSEFSTLTAALEADEAAEPVPIDPHAPPAGPPAPVPLWIYHDDPGRPPTPISTLPPMPSS